MKPAKVSPRQMAALQAAMALHNAGRLDEADGAYRAFLREVPAHPDALHLRALVAHARGRFAEAVQLADGAIARAPHVANFHNTAGEAHRRLQQNEQALRRLQEAVRLDPALAMARRNLALALSDAGRLGEALAAARRAQELAAGWVEARLTVVELLVRAGDFGAAARDEVDRLCAVAAPAAAQSRALYLTQAARAHLQGLAFTQARTDAQCAVAASPGFWGGWAVLAEAHNELGALAQAEEACRVAARLAPDNKDACLNLAHLLREQDRMEEAEGHYAAWLARHPQDANARFGCAVTRLARGDYAAWPDYEARWALGGASDPHARLPRWDGGACTSLLLYAEQGLGDFLQMLRFMPEAARRCGGAVTVLVPQPLAHLVRRNLPAAVEVVAGIAAERTFAAACPVMSLPLALQADRREKLLATGAYVQADAQRTAALRNLLARTPGRKLGIVWQGAAGSAANRRRSLPEAALRPLLELQGWTAVSLQFGVPQPVVAGRPLLDLSGDIRDFDDLAAAMQAVDAIVSLDTGPAHLAGAMGLPCSVLLPRLHDWRWGVAGETCDWYASLRLARQGPDGSWTGAVAAAATWTAAASPPRGP